MIRDAGTDDKAHGAGGVPYRAGAGAEPPPDATGPTHRVRTAHPSDVGGERSAPSPHPTRRSRTRYRVREIACSARHRANRDARRKAGVVNQARVIEHRRKLKHSAFRSVRFDILCKGRIRAKRCDRLVEHRPRRAMRRRVSEDRIEIFRHDGDVRHAWSSGWSDESSPRMEFLQIWAPAGPRCEEREQIG